MRQERLRQIRVARDLKVTELAERTGISAKQLSRYESGESEPTSSAIEKIVRVLGVSSDYLLGITDETGDRYAEDELSEMERRLLHELRDGRVTEALETLAVLAKKH